MKYRSSNPETGFRCRNCHAWVTTDAQYAGVNNRNHCPYCLWSRHLDLHRPGDRLCACKGAMQPVALTLKRTFKRYASVHPGELMLVHRCVECGRISLNRIAADDHAGTLAALFDDSLSRPEILSDPCYDVLGEEARPLVMARLFGWSE